MGNNLTTVRVDSLHNGRRFLSLLCKLYGWFFNVRKLGNSFPKLSSTVHNQANDFSFVMGGYDVANAYISL